MITARTLGVLDITVDGRPAPRELRWRKNIALLVYLARSPERTRPREHLIGLLWGDASEDKARHSLTVALGQLRLSTGEAGLASVGDRVVLGPGVVTLDVDALDALVAARDWERAAAVFSGEFLPGFRVPQASEFETWLGAERERWRRRGIEALLGHAAARLAAGDLVRATEAAERAAAVDGTSEAAARSVMTCLALAGDRAGALACHERLTRNLDREVGTEPGAETRALVERIRRERVWRRPQPAASSVDETAVARRAPLEERVTQLAELLAVWTDCREKGRAAFALIDGDPGTGKTRLGEEVLARTRLDGAATAAVRAVEADLTEPWSGVFALARAGLIDASGVAAAPATALAAFAARIPEWQDRFAAAIRNVAPEPPGRSLGDVVRALTAEQPVVLFVDDAHWLDRDSLLGLGALIRDLAGAPLLILLSAAPYPPRAELDDLRAHIGRDARGAAVSLPPLSADALRALARWARPRYTDAELDRLTRRIASDSAGLPLLAIELLHAVALGLDLRDAPTAWPEPLKTLHQTLPGSLPDSTVAAIRVGFQRVSADARKVLQAASVLGDRVPAAVLGRATGLTAGDLDGALDELEYRQWLVADPRGYSFLARIVRQVVERDLVMPGQRQRFLDAANT